MRLTSSQVENIKSTVNRVLNVPCRVWLFGSRVNDSLRGGDIDLLVEIPKPLKNRVAVECQLTARLYIKLGGRKVDILIKDSCTPIEPIHQQALLHGVML